MNEVARGFGLTRDVRLEISIDAVLHFAVEGLVQQSFEAIQAVRVVGQTKFTDFRKVLQTGLRYVDGVVQRDHMGFTIDPQH